MRNCAALVMAWLLVWTVKAIEINTVEPTPLFPQGEPLLQLTRLHLDNPGQPVAAAARITVGAQPPVIQDLGALATGKSIINVRIPDISAPSLVTIELVAGDGTVLASRKCDWQPQKKWTIYACSYSHQDLGFGDYPHRLRTSIRHENIRLPLQFCRETDDWPDDAKYRFNIETSEPLTSFISFNGKDAARDLARRIREDRIGLGGLHNTANTEELSHELMARLFYMTGRHAVDMLGVPAGKTIQNDDVIGLTWPLATYAKEAGFDYCFHGFNRLTMPNIENGRLLWEFPELDSERGRHVFSIGNEPNFFWQGPDGQQLLRRATTYERHDLLDNPYEKNPSPVQSPDRVELLVRAHEKMNWPLASLLSQDGGDFILVRRVIADRARKWNAEYAWPHIRFATFDDYFRAIENEMAGKQIKLNTVAGDENNQWSDQDYAAARATSEARRLSEALPATETLASIAQAMAGGGDQWINLFAGYHRLLQYFEHTNAKNTPDGNMVWYETELEENREMVREAADYQQKVFANAAQRMAGVITRGGERNLIVFNPLPYRRTDIVRVRIPAACAVDEAGNSTPVQQLADGTGIFVAKDIPATGYQTYALEGAPISSESTGGDLESRFYTIHYNPETGALMSLFDKSLGVELVETNAPNGFNEYLYEFRTSTGGLNFDSRWSRMEKADSIALSRGPVADVLTVTGKAEGVRALKQTVILYRDQPRVDFGIWMDKAPFRGRFNRQHEAVFVALPLAIPKFTIRHELPGCVVEPYRQQIEGSATDHYAIGSFTDLSNENYGVTVSPVEGSLVCYGAPTTTPLHGQEYNFKRDRTYPSTSRLYMYLLDNMFDVNIAADQQGPVAFNWSLRSHAGDWKAGGADRFGRSIQQPLLAWRADGRNKGSYQPGAGFMTVDAPNVMCSVIKPAEMNGRGYIIRLNETSGRETTATISLPMLPAIESVKETSLVENDRTEIGKGNTFKVTLRKFGVKTYRITCAGKPAAITGLAAKAVADMQVELNWKGEGSHFNIYRDTQSDCAATQLNFIGQSATGNFNDRPRVNPGGWLRSCLAPGTTYYYRVVPVDRANNPGIPSEAVVVATPDQPNLPPVVVEGVRAIPVSPITKDNYVNVLFRTSCEPDVVKYEIYRNDAPVGVVNSDDIPPRSGGYGESKIQYKVRDYDHAFYTDKAVEPGTDYSYKIRAVDAAGQAGAFSEVVSMQTKGRALVGLKVTAQSVYAPEFGAALALDGDPDPYQAWISKPYGGGTKANPLDVWWTVEILRQPVTIKGVKIVGDHRPEIPVQATLQVQVRENGNWKTVGETKESKDKDIIVNFPAAMPVSALRVFFPAADLPKSPNRADTDGIVRICELKLVLPDGTESAIE